jgi:hypothetical protein
MTVDPHPSCRLIVVVACCEKSIPVPAQFANAIEAANETDCNAE